MKKAMKQSTMILLLNAFSILLLTAIAAFFLVNVSLSSDIAAANKNRFDLTYNANRFMNGSSYLTNEVRAFASTGARVHYDNYWNEINTLKNRDIGVEAMKAIGITADEQAMIEQMSALSTKLVPLEENAMKQTEAGNLASAMNYVYGSDYSSEIARINEIKTAFLEALDQRTQAYITQLNRTNNVLILILMILIALIILMQLVTYLITRRKIIKPLAKVQMEMKEISDGNLSYQSDLEPDTSEIGMLIDAMANTKAGLKKYIGDITYQLAKMADGDMSGRVEIEYIGDFLPIGKALETILDFLNQMFEQINQSAEQVSCGSDQMSSGAQALSQGATEQASSIETLVMTITDISSQVKDNAHNAIAASHEAHAVEDEAQESNGRMNEMLAAMDDISKRSSEIGKIIKAIEDIAFQTNILALNAAVEAARAGAAGKGFAVVADEVRNLASKSAVASKNTSELIAGSLKAVENGTRIANDTASSLADVVKGIQEVSYAIDRISTASDGQAQSITQVSNGMEQIASVVQTNSATAEESAAASEELFSQAQLLRGLVSRFTLRAGAFTQLGGMPEPRSASAQISTKASGDFAPVYSYSSNLANY